MRLQEQKILEIVKDECFKKNNIPVTVNQS